MRQEYLHNNKAHLPVSLHKNYEQQRNEKTKSHTEGTNPQPHPYQTKKTRINNKKTHNFQPHTESHNMKADTAKPHKRSPYN